MSVASASSALTGLPPLRPVFQDQKSSPPRHGGWGAGAPAKPEGRAKAAPPRTPGTWLFDTLVYPGLANVGVFLVSVFATYQTTYGKDGNWMRRRGDAVRQFFAQRLKLPRNSVDFGVMLAFSFLDGCIIAPFVKLLEDRRRPISRWLDTRLGTRPPDDTPYNREPKQTWASVLAGRATGCATIVPAAVLLDKKWGGRRSLNDRLFSTPGEKLGGWLTRRVPALPRALPGINLPGLVKIGVFEFFYTSLTTAALYASSRHYAKKPEGMLAVSTAKANSLAATA